MLWLQHVVFRLQYMCSFQYSVSSVQCCEHCTLRIVQCAVWSVQCAVCMCSVQCAVFSVQCAVCSVQCAVYNTVSGADLAPPGAAVGGSMTCLGATVSSYFTILIYQRGYGKLRGPTFRPFGKLLPLARFFFGSMEHKTPFPHEFWWFITIFDASINT